MESKIYKVRKKNKHMFRPFVLIGMRVLMHMVSPCVACVYVYVYLFAKYMLSGVVRVCYNLGVCAVVRSSTYHVAFFTYCSNATVAHVDCKAIVDIVGFGKLETNIDVGAPMYRW